MPLHPLAYGPATPQQEGVGGRVAAKEKWVWGGGCGCECGCIGRWGQGRSMEPGQEQSLSERGRKVKTRRLGCNPLPAPPLQDSSLSGPWSPAYAPGILAIGSNTGAEELGLMGTQGQESSPGRGQTVGPRLRNVPWATPRKPACKETLLHDRKRIASCSVPAGDRGHFRV